MTKTELRDDARRRLATMDPETARAASGRAVERVLALPEVARARHVLTCLSFGTELDTWQLVERLRAAGRRVYVPRAGRRDRRLHVHPYPCELRRLSFGLRQPRPGAPELAPEAVDATLEVAVVLGLAFDRRGSRLGYGGGYFDRFLAGRPFPAVGLAFHHQLVERLPSEDHDVPMSVVVTEEGVWRPVAAEDG